ncbi:MAG: uracil-DNA glycosylase family protein [Nitrospira sp.]|nr:uracil-DNA glycosylase family protein [Nitrospira sp.]
MKPGFHLTHCPNFRRLLWLYIMGFNPGGNPDQSMKLEQSLHDDKLMRNFSSYKDECWYDKCPEDCTNTKHYGDKPHQKRVRRLAEILGYNNIREVFAANAIFVRSRDQNTLADRKTLFDKCWPIHQQFLSIVQPKIILCLGNGERSSAFSFLKEKLKANEVTSGNVKVFVSKIPMANGIVLESKVIGVRHPSRFNSVKDLELYHQKTMVQ